MKILIGDDHAVVRSALRFLIDAQPDMEVLDEAADGHEIFMKLEHLAVDIVLMDISMPPGENGLQTAKRIKEMNPKMKIVILTMHDEKMYVQEALNAEIDGYILKTATDEVLLEGIRRVHRGERFYSGYSEEMLNQIPTEAADPLYEALSKREKEILPLVAMGYNNKEIAERLFISVKTVEVHKANLRKKLHLNSQAELLRYSITHHLVDF